MEKTSCDAKKRIDRLGRHSQNTMDIPRSSQATDNQLSSAESLLTELKFSKDTLEGGLSNITIED